MNPNIPRDTIESKSYKFNGFFQVQNFGFHPSKELSEIFNKIGNLLKVNIFEIVEDTEENKLYTVFHYKDGHTYSEEITQDLRDELVKISIDDNPVKKHVEGILYA